MRNAALQGKDEMLRWRMNARELQSQVMELSPEEFKVFEQWFEEYLASQWDAQIERDAKAGKLDFLVERTKRNIALGQFTEL